MNFSTKGPPFAFVITNLAISFHHPKALILMALATICALELDTPDFLL